MTASQRSIDEAGELLRSRIGLRPERSFRGRLARAIGDTAGQVGAAPDDFVATLAGDPASLQRLFDNVTVQETGFFRHPEHFDMLARHLLPAVRGPVRVWSAACANGQEAYTVAMVLAEAGVSGRVLATDVSSAAVGRTRAARYSDREVGGLDPRRLSAHGSRDGATWTVHAALRERIDASIRNLLDPLPAEVASCQIVFCRNVLIYFTPEHARAFLNRLADRLPAGAHLFLGAAESMWHISERFESVRFGDTFVYRVRTGARPPTADPDRKLRAVVARARPRPRPVPAPAVPTPIVLPADVTALARLGRAALAVGDTAAAVRTFRRWIYLDPTDALAHLHLGLALEADDDRTAATRSFAVSRSLLLRGSHRDTPDAFGGYGLDDLLRLLEAKGSAP